MQNIYVWYGSMCNRYERLKATELAIDIRDNERRGRGKMHLIDEGEEPAEVLEVRHPLKCTSTWRRRENPSHTALASVGTGLGGKSARCDGPSLYR